MKPYTIGCYGLLAGVLIGLAGVASAANVTWDNSGGTLRWNTTEDNWVGTTTYTGGDNVTFGTTGAGSVYIGTTGPTPVNVAPGSVSITAGTYTFSGGDITSGSFSQSGTGNSTFTGSLTFGGGATLSAGTFTFNPATVGTYGFGSGAITLSGGSFKLGGPTTGITTLTNNITLGAATVLWDVGSATNNPAILSGNITLTGNPTFGNAHPYAPKRPLQVTGTIYLNGADRTINSWNEAILGTTPTIAGNVDGGGTRNLILGPDWFPARGISIGGNGGWNIKNLNCNSIEVWVVPATDSTDFFSGIRANGGKVNLSAGVMHWLGGAFHFGDFNVTGTGRIEADLTSGRTVNITGGSITAANLPNGLWLTPGSGVLSSNVTVSSGGVLRNIFYASATTPITKFSGGSLNLCSGGVYEVATGNGNWNTQVRLALQAQNAGDSLRLGDGNAGTAETVTFRGSCNVPYNSSAPTRGFIVQFDQSQVTDDGNVVLRYETPTNNPMIRVTDTAVTGTYDSNDRLIFGWSDRTNSTIQYQFRGGSAGTEFVPRLASVAALGPTAGTVFTATSPTRLLSAGTNGFYNSTAAMDFGTLGPVVIASGGTFDLVSNGVVNASSLTLTNGGAISGIGQFSVTNVTVYAGGVIDPGNPATAGILTLTNASTCALQFNGAATLAVDVRGTGGVAGTDYDRLAVKSAVTGLANVNLVVRFPLGKAGFTGQTLTILTSGNDLSAQTFLSITFQDGYTGTVNYGNGFVTLTNVRHQPKGTAIHIR